jgi:hypothetical protein
MAAQLNAANGLDRLAGAGLADDEGRRIAGTDPMHTIQQCLGRRVFKNQTAGADREGQCVRVRGNDLERCFNTWLWFCWLRLPHRRLLSAGADIEIVLLGVWFTVSPTSGQAF